MTRSPEYPITVWVPENSAASLTIEPNDAGGPPVLIFESEAGDLEVFNWEAQSYQPVDLVDAP
jgi:hypothetical protein